MAPWVFRSWNYLYQPSRETASWDASEGASGRVTARPALSVGPSRLGRVTEHAPACPPVGVLVAVEGGDGAGKSTQIERLVARLTERGVAHVVTREPGGTETGTRIRELLLHGGGLAPRTEALLFAADRAEHVERVILPALDAGEVVVTDRFADSSIAYQGAGRALDAGEVRDLSWWATGGLVPDLTVLLDVPPELGRARRGTTHDRVEAEPDAFHARVREHFLALAAADPVRYLVLDAGRDPDDLAGSVSARVEELLAARGLLADPSARGAS